MNTTLRDEQTRIFVHFVHYRDDAYEFRIGISDRRIVHKGV